MRSIAIAIAAIISAVFLFFFWSFTSDYAHTNSDRVVIAVAAIISATSFTIIFSALPLIPRLTNLPVKYKYATCFGLYLLFNLLCSLASHLLLPAGIYREAISNMILMISIAWLVPYFTRNKTEQGAAANP